MLGMRSPVLAVQLGVLERSRHAVDDPVAQRREADDLIGCSASMISSARAKPTAPAMFWVPRALPELLAAAAQLAASNGVRLLEVQRAHALGPVDLVAENDAASTPSSTDIERDLAECLRRVGVEERAALVGDGGERRDVVDRPISLLPCMIETSLVFGRIAAARSSAWMWPSARGLR